MDGKRFLGQSLAFHRLRPHPISRWTYSGWKTVPKAYNPSGVFVVRRDTTAMEPGFSPATRFPPGVACAAPAPGTHRDTSAVLLQPGGTALGTRPSEGVPRCSLLSRLLDRAEIPQVGFCRRDRPAGTASSLPAPHLESSSGEERFGAAANGTYLVRSSEGFSVACSPGADAEACCPEGRAENSVTARLRCVSSPANNSLRAVASESSPPDADPAKGASRAAQDFAGPAEYCAGRGFRADAAEGGIDT